MIKYFSAWLFLLFANMPVAFSLAVMAVLWLLITDSNLLVNVPQRLVGGIDSFPLLAVPFFILAGHLMNSGGISERIYAFARSIVGHLKGGLGHVNVLGSLIFSGMSGSAVADAGGLGILEIKAMREDGYDDAFSGALTAASCIIGPLVPPPAQAAKDSQRCRAGDFHVEDPMRGPHGPDDRVRVHTRSIHQVDAQVRGN